MTVESRRTSYAAMAEDLPSFNELEICPPTSTKKGSVRQSVISLDGQPFKFNVGPARIPFEVRPYNDAESSTRLNLNLEVTDPACEQYFEQLDQKIVELVASKSVEHFNKELSLDHIKLMYKSLLQKNGTYNSTIRSKINLESPRKLRAWNEEKEQVDLPPEFKNLDVVAAVAVKCLWFVANMFGATLECSDIMICENASVDICPF